MKLSEILAQREKVKENTKSGGNAPKPKPKSGGQQPSKIAPKRALKVLRTRETPNPNSLQFMLNNQVMEFGKLSYPSKESAKDDKMASAVFEHNGVVTVFVTENFVTVTKSEAVSWDPLVDKVWKEIDTHIDYYKTGEKEEFADIDTGKFSTLSHEDKLKAIELVLNRSIRSALARDGGGVELKGLFENEVLIRYQGACGSCPTSTTGTLKQIESQVQRQLDKNLVVKSV